MAKWWGGFIIYRMRNRVLELLLQPSENTNPRYKLGERQIKFPGGDWQVPDADSFETACRELREETNLGVASDLRIRFIISMVKGPDHFQDFFSIPEQDCEGTLRTEEITGEDTILYPPEWVPLWKVKGMIYRTHELPYRAFMESIGKYGPFTRTGNMR